MKINLFLPKGPLQNIKEEELRWTHRGEIYNKNILRQHNKDAIILLQFFSIE